MNNRRVFLGHLVTLCALGPARALADESKSPLVKVWKTPTCGCCGKWVTHMRKAGFTVEATDVPDVGPYKQQYGLPAKLASCHTAVVEGYVVEGHVPADDVIRMLKLKPEIVGIAVPGMPAGSPGMESPRPVAYDVLAFDTEGNTTVFATHTP